MPKTMVVYGSEWIVLYSHKETHALIQKGQNGLYKGIIYCSQTNKSEKWF